MPVVQTSVWDEITSMELDVRNMGRILHVLTHHLSPPWQMPLSFISLFGTIGEIDREGVLLTTFSSRAGQQGLALLLSPAQKPAIISDKPALLLSSPVTSPREVATFRPSTLYNLWLDYQIKPARVFESIVTLFTDISLSMGDGPVQNAMTQLGVRFRLLKVS